MNILVSILRRSIGEQIADFGFNNIACLPLVLTENSKRPTRIFALIIFVPWLYTFGLIGVVISLIGLGIDIFSKLWISRYD